MLLSRVSLSGACTSWYILSLNSAFISSKNSGSTPKDLYSNFGFPQSFWISEIKLQSFLISTCAVLIASSIVSFGISSAPASIIVIFSSVAATVKVNLDFSLCSTVGLITICPST